MHLPPSPFAKTVHPAVLLPPPSPCPNTATPAVLLPPRRHPNRAWMRRPDVSSRNPGVSAPTPPPVPVGPHVAGTRRRSERFHPHRRRRRRCIVHACSAPRHGQRS